MSRSGQWECALLITRDGIRWYPQAEFRLRQLIAGHISPGATLVKLSCKSTLAGGGRGYQNRRLGPGTGRSAACGICPQRSLGVSCCGHPRRNGRGSVLLGPKCSMLRGTGARYRRCRLNGWRVTGDTQAQAQAQCGRSGGGRVASAVGASAGAVSVTARLTRAGCGRGQGDRRVLQARGRSGVRTG